MIQIRVATAPSGIKAETVHVNDIPSWKWTRKEHQLWQGETWKILEMIQKLKVKCALFTHRVGMYNDFVRFCVEKGIKLQ